MKNKNILITSAGKRVVLVEIFKSTIQELCNGKVFTTDMNPHMAPACIISDGAFTVPAATSPYYPDILLSLCLENEISIIIPTIDTELLVLSQKIEKFSIYNIQIIVSDYSFISICRDKRNTADFFTKLDIRNPKPVDISNPTFPIFAKPYDGSLSKDLYHITQKEQLNNEIINNSKLIFMEYIDRKEFTEFTVDMYYGKDGMIKSIVPRERIEIRAGEINKGITRKNYLVEYIEDRMNNMPQIRGCICIQLFYKLNTCEVIGIEINPRFGGGYPLSYYAGENYAKYIIEEYILGKEIIYNKDWKDNTLMLRYDKEIVLYDTK